MADEKRATLIDPIDVGCYRYKVLVDPMPFRAKARHADDRGYVNHDLAEMVVRPNQTIDLQRETVLHEVIHGVRYLANLPSGEVEESFVTRMTPLLLDTLRRNPHLRQFLFKEDE